MQLSFCLVLSSLAAPLVRMPSPTLSILGTCQEAQQQYRLKDIAVVGLGDGEK